MNTEYQKEYIKIIACDKLRNKLEELDDRRLKDNNTFKNITEGGKIRPYYSPYFSISYHSAPYYTSYSYTINPSINVCSIKERLQQFANAARCFISFTSNPSELLIEGNREISDYILTYDNILEGLSVSYPTYKEVRVYNYTYKEDSGEREVYNEDTTSYSNKKLPIIYGFPGVLVNYGYTDGYHWSGNLSTTSDLLSTTVTWSANNAGHPFRVTARAVSCDEDGYNSQTINSNSGEILEWRNPMINSGSYMSSNVALMLKDYFSSLMYDFDTRGNPEIEEGDKIYLNDGNTLIQIEQISLKFNGAFSGHIKAVGRSS